MKISDASISVPVRTPLSPQLFFAAIASVMGGGFHFGFQISLVNPMAHVLQSFLLDDLHENYGYQPSERITALLWSIVVSILLIGAAIGSVIVAKIIEIRGPLKALLASATIQLISVLMSMTSGIFSSSGMFVIARFLSGIGVGMAASAQGVFLAEISPNAHRGKIGTFGGFSTNIGFVSAAALGLPFVLGSEKLWFLVFAIEAIPCAIFIISSLTWIQESPVHLLKTGQHQAAKKAIATYGCLELYQQAELKKQDSISTLGSLWSDRASRKVLLLSVILNVAVSFSGITAVSFFGTHMLSSLGFSDASAATMNCICSTAGTAGALLAIVTTDKVGNRVLVLSGLVLLALLDTCMMLLVFLYSATKLPIVGWVFFTLFVLFLFVFSAGIGPAAWSLGAELAPDRCRAKVQSIAVCAQYIACFISPILYYPLTEAVGPISFLVFIVPLLLMAVYLFQHLPEGTRNNKRRKQIEAELGKY